MTGNAASNRPWHLRMRLWLAIAVAHDVLRLPDGYGVFYPAADDE